MARTTASPEIANKWISLVIFCIVAIMNIRLFAASSVYRSWIARNLIPKGEILMHRTLLSVFTVVAATSMSHARSTIFNYGFEPAEGFAAGSPLRGQRGWDVTRPTEPGHFTVLAGQGVGGSHGVSASATRTLWAWPAETLPAPTSGRWRFSADMLMKQSSLTAPGQPEFGIEVYGLVNGPNGPENVPVAGIVLSPRVRDQNNNTLTGYAMFWTRPTGSTIPFYLNPIGLNPPVSYPEPTINSWHTLTLDLNLNIGVYEARVNGRDWNMRGLIPFWSPGMSITDFNLRSGGVSNNQAYFDNARLAVVPEPAAALTGLASGCLILRRRR
jgi:hypothetical protein